MGDDKKKPEGVWKEGVWGGEVAGKKGYEDKRFERGVGNRTPEKPPEGEHKRELSFGPLFKAETNIKGAMYDSRPDPEAKDADTSFIQVMQGKAGDFEAISGLVNLNEGKAKGVLARFKAEGSVVHAELDIVDKITSLIFGKKAPPPPPPPNPPPPAPMAVRIGDPTAHCTLLAPGIPSPNVLIGGQPAWLGMTSMHVCSQASPTPHGMGVVTPAQTTVFINGMLAARAGDVVIEPVGGPNMILLGCTTVLIGPQAPPAPPFTPPGPPKELPWVKFESVAKGDVGAVEADLQAYGEVNLAEGKGIAEFQGGAAFALFKGELPLKVRIRIPNTEYYFGIGVTGEASLISVGAEAGAGVKINQNGKLFDGTAGAKIGAGLGGVGVKFGVDIAK